MELATHVAGLFSERPEVESVALGGSLRSDHVDAATDVDLYVYTRADIPLDIRREIVRRSGRAGRVDLGLDYWGPGDEWLDSGSDIEVDVVYFDAHWMQDQVNRVMRDHKPSLGYSTCFAFTVRRSLELHDPRGWFAGLQTVCREPYPEALRRNIVAHNHPVLRQIIPSYYGQLEKAVQRGDLVSVNHRLAGLLASYFDILFAVNRELHPGEKRLPQKAAASCSSLPENMETEITAVLTSAGTPADSFLAHVTRLLDHLDALLVREGFPA